MKKTKSIIIALALILALTLSVSASNGSKAAELFYRDIKITLNGQSVTPKDANGNAVEPFIIDGTTYLPVRGVAGALGLDVEWDGETNTVILSEKEPEITETSPESLILDYKGIQVYYRGITAGDSFWGGINVNLRIVNNYGKNITVQARDESVNGIMIDSIFSSDVVNGKTALDEITIMQSSLDKAAITKVESAEFKLHIFESDGWETIYDSEPITVK